MIESESTTEHDIHILPYSLIVGQEPLKLALEISYIAPKIGGVLISGHSGTGKSTAVRAFSQMMYGSLPVTLPINATEDRVVGGWRIDELMRGKEIIKAGLLEEADKGILFIDEVNLLDDHIVNIILDVSSTGVLDVQRDGIRLKKNISFTLIGTMNLEEGGLGPQLLDRFGLLVGVKAETDMNIRSQILRTVLDFDTELRGLKSGKPSQFIEDGKRLDGERKKLLEKAKNRFDEIKISNEIMKKCINICSAFESEGHRGDYVIAMAARAYAAIIEEQQVSSDHINFVAPFALQHRRTEILQSGREQWSDEDDTKLEEILKNVQ
jgi:magnesium chelatase subunit I